MKPRRNNDTAVSEIVGEMLMLTIVLILLAVLSSSVSMYLPPPRDPGVTIRMNSSLHDGNVTLYHKGGDTLKTSEITVIVEKGTDTRRYSIHDTVNMTVIGYSGTINPPLFDLGDSLEVSGIGNGVTISLSTSRAVIFSGKVP